MNKEWKEICANKDWNCVIDRPSYKPRIVELVECFEQQYPETEFRERTACLAVATYLFGPIEDEEELELYIGIIKRRLRDYRNQPIQ
jgi:hypothetical protein